MEEKQHDADHKSHKHQKEETITLTKTQLWQIVSAVLALALVASIWTSGFSFDTGSSVKVAAAPSPPSAAPSNPPATGEVSLDNVRSSGDEDAPVVIVEYSDFQCPFCSRFYSDTKPQVDQQYVAAGKVQFVYKDFPLDSIHPQATPAALAGWCAHEQGKFWEMHDLMFAGQASLNDASYKKWAADLGLNTQQFNECYDSKKYANNVQAELAEGSANGIRGTPGFVVLAPDGSSQLISGAQPFAAFQAAIEAALQKA